MKREVPPIIGVVVILAALTVVQMLYWQGLIGGPGERRTVGPTTAGGGRRLGAANSAWAHVTTVAGSPEPGYRDGPAREARFDGPAGVALGDDGTVYLADSRNHCLRALATDGQVSIMAGAAGEAGYADGPAEQARFSAPAGVAVALDGSLLVCDTGNHRIRRITPAGIVSTYAGAETPRDELGRELGGYQDGPASQARFRYPVGIAVDASGVVYVADPGNHRVRRISPGGEVSTVAVAGQGEMKTPAEVALAPDNRVWVADTSGGDLWVGPPAGPLEPLRVRGDHDGVLPAGIAVVAAETGPPEVYLLDAGNHCLWQVEGERLTLVAGQPEAWNPGWEDGPGDSARFSCPAGLATGPDGWLYVADFGNNCLRRVAVAAGDKEAF